MWLCNGESDKEFVVLGKEFELTRIPEKDKSEERYKRTDPVRVGSGIRR